VSIHDSFGESSILFDKPHGSTVRCATDTCHLHEMLKEDFMAVVKSSPDLASFLKNICRKRFFKRFLSVQETWIE
jgi:CRP-like cAMP-binding protein